MDRLAAMEVFVRVVETGSFSAAARGLNVGQPAVSKSIAQLEERLGVELLMRSPRGVVLTEAGQKFYERARTAIEAAEEADIEARGAGAGLTGRLRIAASVTFGRLHVVPRLPGFLAAHPALTMELLLDDRIIDLVEQGVDVALRSGAPADPSVTARRLARGRRLLVGAPAYFERRGEPTSPAELTDHDTITYTQVGGESWSFLRDGTEVSIGPSGRLRISAAEGVRAAVLAGMGLAVASEWTFAQELASGAVRPVLTDWTLPAVNLWAVYPGRMPSAKARAFAAFVEAELGAAHSSLG